MRIGVVIAGGGSGSRMGGVNKPFLVLGDRTVIERVTTAFLQIPEVAAVRVALPAAMLDSAEVQAISADSRLRCVAGGPSRGLSVKAGVDALPEVDVIVVHDAARPFVDSGAVRQAAIRVEREQIGLVMGRRVTDTLKETDGDRVTASPDRARFWRAETPQLFPAALFRATLRAEEGSLFLATDDATVAARHMDVRMIQAPDGNLKLTTAEDLRLAELLLVSRGGQP